VRIAAWILIVCTVLGVTGVFLPCAEVHVAGVAVSKRTEISLYAINRDRDLARALLTKYGKHRGRLGQALAAAMLPHVRNHTREYADEAKSAMDSLDDVSDSDITMAGRLLTATIWAFLALQAIMAALVFADMMRSDQRRRRVIVPLVLAIVVAAIAIAIHFGLREAVWEANDDIGYNTIAMGIGGYMIPIAALGGFGAAIALVVLERKRRALDRTSA
jgi:hypothetical protein